jgi:acetyl esterase
MSDSGALAQSLLARSLAALSPRTARVLSGRRAVVLDGQILDPGIQLLLGVMRLRGEATFISSPRADPARERQRTNQLARAVAHWRTPVGGVTDVEVAGAEGPLRARHYVPVATAPPGPLLVYLHGGGFVAGGFDTHDEACRLLCHHGGIHVLSVDYRLAPEHPFPAAVEDSLAAFRWAHDHAPSLGADPHRVAIGGDSAGGNLSAVTAHRASREGGPAPALQVLIYPGTDMAARTHSGELFAEGFFLDQTSMDWCLGHYIPADVDLAHPWLSPLRQPDLHGLAPAIVVTAAFDPLRDEGEAYAARLRAAHNRVELVRVAGLIHGFLNLTVANRPSRDATIGLAGMIRGALMPV